MGAVIDDHGVYNDLSEYVNSQLYKGMGPLDRAWYPMVRKTINASIASLREEE